MDNGDLLHAVAAKLDRSGVPDRQFPDGKGEYWAHCPFHDDAQATNFSASVKGFNCFACGQSGSLIKLARHLHVRSAPSRAPRLGRTGANVASLQNYARMKRLPLEFLKGL